MYEELTSQISFTQWSWLFFFFFDHFWLRHCHSRDSALWIQYMALYRHRKWITPSINGNKINTNVFIGSLSGAERYDSWHLSNYRYSLSASSPSSMVSFPFFALSTLSRTLAHREWVTWNKHSYRRHCFLQPDGQYAALGSQATFMLSTLNSPPWQ